MHIMAADMQPIYLNLPEGYKPRDSLEQLII